MPKNARILLLSCFIAITGLLTLQAYWIVKYYHITLNNFEKDVNLAFEDALKTEFNLRCDTIQKAIENRLIDTNYFKISAKLDQEQQNYIYTIDDVRNPKDSYNSSFSTDKINRPLNKNDDTTRKQIAALFALMTRSEDLENHIVYYRLQSLGKFTLDKTVKLQFDTARLRPVFNSYLKKRGIKPNYSFITRVKDSLTNETKLKDSLKSHYSTVTKALPTYNYQKKMDYVRAGFRNPLAYVLSNMALILVSSILLFAIITGLIVFILKTLFKEKRLASIKNDFISNITHEFKTPIATIAAATESLGTQQTINDAEKRDRYLNYVKEETEKLNLLVDQVLHLSVYESGEVTIAKEEIYLDNAIRQLIQTHQLAASKPVHFEYENNPTQTISADQTQFFHAINNVIDNAIKYSGDSAQIHISATEKNGFVQLIIKDEGIGIDNGDMKLVFDKFYRVTKGNKHRVKGYGLGLNYVKQIMTAHHGWYQIESKVNHGTTLILAWPK